MAREGLRTLVVAKKTLSQDTYNDFEVRDCFLATYLLGQPHLKVFLL